MTLETSVRKPNLNEGAKLDVSPAVRDCLGMDDTDVTDWKFVDFDESWKDPARIQTAMKTKPFPPFPLQQRSNPFFL